MSKIKRILVIIGTICAVLSIISTVFRVYERTTYERYAGKDLFLSREIKVSYMDETVDIAGLNNMSLITHLQYREREKTFKKIESDKCITIESSKGALINIYPRDNDSVFLTLTVNNKMSFKYIMHDSDFNEFLEMLYEITENDVFNI